MLADWIVRMSGLCGSGTAALGPSRPSSRCLITHYISLSASLNGIVRSTLPVESKTRISPERKRPNQRARSHTTVIRIHDEAGNVVETHEQAGDFREW